MKVTEKKDGEGRVKLEAIASPAEVNHAFKLAEQAFAHQVRLKPEGGKTIAQAAEDQLGIKDLDAILRKDIVEYLAPFAIDKRNLIPAYPPTPSLNKPVMRNQPFEFSLSVVLKPDYELDSYDPVHITVPALSISPAEVEAQLGQILDNYADYVSVAAHPVGEHDAVDVALKVTENGKPIEALTTDNRLYVMGIGLMPPAFDEQLLGMEVGQTKSFTLSLPGFESDLDCTVTVNELKEKRIPELTDEWVKENFPMYGSAQAMREFVENSVKWENEKRHEDQKLGMAAAELARRFHGKIDDAVYESMRSTVLNNMQMSLAKEGIPMQEFIQSQGGEQQFGMMLMLQTRQMLVQGYALDALYRHEGLTLDEKDLLDAAATMNPQNPALAKRQMEEMGRGFALREMAQRMKANKWLLEHADVTEGVTQESVPGAPEGIAQEEPAEED